MTPRLALTLLVVGVLAACGGRQAAPEGGEAILVAGESLIGEPEERAAGFLLDLAFVLEANLDDPQKAAERVEAVLAVNGQAMRDNAAALEARLASLSGDTRRRYEAQFAAHIGPAHAEWRQRLAAFTSAWPDEGRQIARRVATFGR